MYLCIYKKRNKLYYATVKKITEKIAITNQDFKTVVLGYKNKIKSYKFDSLEDLKKIYPELREKFACKLYLLENKYNKLTQVKLVVFLLNNPLWEVGIHQKETENDIEEGKTSTRTIEIENYDDWKLAEQEFDFKSDFIYSIF